MFLAIRSYYPALIEAGVRVFEYQPFEDDLTRSREVTKDAVARRGFVTTLAEGTARLLSPLL